MRTRFKGPDGTETLELPDSATVQDLFDGIRVKTSIERFSLRYGPPTAIKILQQLQGFVNAKSLGLHGETLTIVPEERPLTPPAAPRDKQLDNQDLNNIVVPWPGREGLLLLRVMPSDNSCLFTAFGGALKNGITPTQLRHLMAVYIMKHSDLYTEAVLETTPEEYCRRIQDPDRWGGGIELSILSSVFNIQISTYDVQNQSLVNFGEDKRDRCILLYSGIHYDRVAFSHSAYPYTSPGPNPETDRTIWSIEDTEVLEKTSELVKRLNAAHYYTDTDGLVLKCDHLGCEWIGSGQIEGQKHAELTGHGNLSEINDTKLTSAS